MQPLISERTYKSSPISRAATLLTLAGCILFIVALATPAIIHTSGLGAIGTDDLTADFGPFRLCYKVGGDSSCKDINRDCHVSFSSGLGISAEGKVVDDCDAWNAGRAFLIIGVIATFAAFLVQMIVACSRYGESGVGRMLAVVLGMIGALCGLISMAVYARLRDNDDSFKNANSSKFEYGFYCIIVGWVAAFFASIPFCISKY